MGVRSEEEEDSAASEEARSVVEEQAEAGELPQISNYVIAVQSTDIESIQPAVDSGRKRK